MTQRYGAPAGTEVTVTRHDYLGTGGDVSQATDQRSTYPIDVPGAGTNYSYEVWHRLEVTAMGGSVEVDTIRHYANSQTPATGITLFTSASTGTPSDETYAQPVITNSTLADQTFPTSDPTSANISGDITSAGYSGYVVTQADVGTTATAGYEHASNTTWKYAEVA
jgi:hypothetical protein